MPSPSPPNHYQLWLNHTTKSLELHGADCACKIAALRMTQFRAHRPISHEQYGAPVMLNEPADFDAMAAKVLKKEKTAPLAQKCAGPFYTEVPK